MESAHFRVESNRNKPEKHPLPLSFSRLEITVGAYWPDKRSHTFNNTESLLLF